MTSEEWIATISSVQDRKYAREAVNAALEKERAGEVVITPIQLLNGQFQGGGFYIDGKRGKLIFREDK